VSESARVAIVGYGLAGSVFHAPFIKTTAGLSLDAVVTGDPERQAEALRKYPDVRVISNVAELLRYRDDWDLVVVAVPNAHHFAVAEAAMLAGLSCVVDKPITPTSDQAQRLAEIAREHDVRIIPYHNRRWDGDFLTVVKMLDAGRLGQIWRYESRFERWRPEAPIPGSWKQDPNLPASGILFDLGSHLVDQVLRLFGVPMSVYAELIGHAEDVDDDSFVALTYPAGVAVHLWASSKAAQLGPRFRILGSQGAYVKYGLDPQEDALRAGLVPTEPDWGEESEEAWGQLGTNRAAETVETLPGDYGAFYAGVAAHLLEGAAPPVEIDDAIAGLKVLEAAVASATSRSVIAIS
jgi:scyllo-inositol 2-dehydrogenase (NADP+)